VVQGADTNIALVANDGLGHIGVTNLDLRPAPLLEIQSYSNVLHVAWVAGAPLLKLETSTNLNPAFWIEVPGPTQVGDQYLMPLDTNAPIRFYRLRYGN
jgi:hypothetical protein